MPNAPKAQHGFVGPDHEAIRSRAADAVKAELGVIARPDERAQRAGEIIHQADVELGVSAPARDTAAMSLWFYEGRRGLNKIMGISPNAYNQIKARTLHGDWRANLNPNSDGTPFPVGGRSKEDRMDADGRRAAAEAAGVAHLENAEEELPVHASAVSDATARRTAAMPFLQDAMLAMSEEPYGWNSIRISDHTGFSDRVIRLHWATARKRRGY